jgi:hypothetical protein
MIWTIPMVFTLSPEDCLSPDAVPLESPLLHEVKIPTNRVRIAPSRITLKTFLNSTNFALLISTSLLSKYLVIIYAINTHPYAGTGGIALFTGLQAFGSWGEP